MTRKVALEDKPAQEMRRRLRRNRGLEIVAKSPRLLIVGQKSLSSAQRERNSGQVSVQPVSGSRRGGVTPRSVC
jgi:hypothetical protein